LTILKETQPYSALAAVTADFVGKMQRTFADAKIPVIINQLGSLFTLFFTADPVTDYDEACRSDTKLYARFFHLMLAAGFYFSPGQFETCFISAAHTGDDIKETLMALQSIVKDI
jgi:glutamate-1-semialdehyde 2,1-aminomutase